MNDIATKYAIHATPCHAMPCQSRGYKREKENDNERKKIDRPNAERNAEQTILSPEPAHPSNAQRPDNVPASSSSFANEDANIYIYKMA